MSKYLPGIIICILFFFTACKKSIIENKENINSAAANAQQNDIACQMRQDAARTAAMASSRTTATPQTPVVLLLDFNGQDVVNSVWSSATTISCPAVPSSLLTTAMKDYIVQSV